MADQLITYSSELMSNFIQSEVAAPDKSFEGLQTDAGLALLFSQGTDGVLYGTAETVNHATGWVRHDLSSALAANYGGTKVATRTFAVAQNLVSSAIDAALAVEGPGHDDLYLALGNSSSDTSWLADPPWVRYPFDDAANPLPQVVIADIFISQASDGEYIIVDVLRDPQDPAPVIFRYYIDPTKKLTGQAWNAHDVSADLNAGKIVSCLGRRRGDAVDGIYTLGAIAGRSQLIYTPLYNRFNAHVAPNPARLTPPGTSPSALATAATDGNFTALFVTSDQTLYYFPDDAQQDGASAIALIQNPLLQDVAQLYAYATTDRVIVWGLNRAQQVFYTTCPLAQMGTAAAWSYPLAIVSGAEAISPYVNRIDDGNTFFAHVGVNQFVLATQAPDTTVWTQQPILLQAPPTAAASKFDSYTTRLQVTDQQRAPQAGAQVELAADHRVSLYVNSRYYVLSPQPIPVPADQSGGIVVVEPVSNLQGTKLTLTGNGGAPVMINPMDKPMNKVATLTSPTALSTATITYQNGATKPLIDQSASPADQQATVDAIGSLVKAYSSLPSASSTAPRPASALGVLASDQFASLQVRGGSLLAPAVGIDTLDLSNALEVTAGDLLSWLQDETNYLVHIIQDAETQLWQFVAEIAGVMYSFVLDAEAKVMGALEVVFEAIKTAIEDVLSYLRYLFDWGDIERTKDVTKKILTLYIGLLIEGVKTLESDLDDLISQAKTAVDSWANVKADTWQPTVPNHDQPSGYMRAITDIEQAMSAPAMLLFHAFSANFGAANTSSSASVDVADQLLDDVITALGDEGDVVLDAIQRIQSELIDGSAAVSMSLEDVLEKLTAIVVDALLNTAEDTINLLLNVFVTLVQAIVASLDDPIWIPIVSDVLADFGVTTKVSLLDVFCYIGAIPATITYKAAKNQAPFSAGDGISDQILAASDVWALSAALGQPQTPPQPARTLHAAAPAATGGPGYSQSSFIPITVPPAAQQTIFIVGHLISGIAGLIDAVIEAVEALSEDEIAGIDTAAGIAAAVSAAPSAVAGLFASPYPIQNPIVSKLSSVLSILKLLGKAVFKLGPYAIAKYRGITDPAEQEELTQKVGKVGAGYDAVIGVLTLAPTCFHFYELSGDPANTERALAIVDEVSNITSVLSKIANFAAVMDEDEESKAIIAAIMCVLIALTGGLQIAEAIVAAASGTPTPQPQPVGV